MSHPVSHAPKPDSRIPVIAVVGLPGSGKGDFLNHMLQGTLADGAVVFRRTGESEAVPLLHPRVVIVPGADVDPESGCFCCGAGSELGDALRDLFLKVLYRRVPPVSRVIVESDSPDGAALRFTLRHAPFLAQRYVLRAVLLLVDARRLLDAQAQGILRPLATGVDAVLLSHADLLDAQFSAFARAKIREWLPETPVLDSTCGLEALAAVGIN